MAINEKDKKSGNTGRKLFGIEPLGGSKNSCNNFGNSILDATNNAVDIVKNTPVIKEAQTPSFSPAPTFNYTKSDAVAQADAMLQQHLANKPGDFSFSMQAGWDDVMNKILNREKFSYDLNGDALYQQYKDQFVTNGKLASMDAEGQARAATGGYGNSFAQIVGQQAYQGYLQGLNDKIPELYQLALDKYNKEGQDLYNKYGMYADKYGQEYGEHRDSVSDYYTDLKYLTDNARYMSETEYNQALQDFNIKYGSYRDFVEDEKWNDTFQYQKNQDKKVFDEGVRQFDKSNKIKSAPEYGELDVGSAAYNAMNDEINSAETWGELQAIAAKYAAMKYDPDVIEALTSAREKELKNKPSSGGNNNSSGVSNVPWYAKDMIN